MTLWHGEYWSIGEHCGASWATIRDASWRIEYRGASWRIEYCGASWRIEYRSLTRVTDRYSPPLGPLGPPRSVTQHCGGRDEGLVVLCKSAESQADVSLGIGDASIGDLVRTTPPRTGCPPKLGHLTLHCWCHQRSALMTIVTDRYYLRELRARARDTHCDRASVTLRPGVRQPGKSYHSRETRQAKSIQNGSRQSPGITAQFETQAKWVQGNPPGKVHSKRVQDRGAIP